MKRLLSLFVSLLITMGIWAQDEMLNTPLTLEAINPGTISVDILWAGAISYRLNDEDMQTCTSAPIEVNPGDKVAIYGERNYLSRINCSADCYVYGNVMSLISSTDYSNLKTLSSGNGFESLFSFNSHIKNHPTKQLVLPATELSESCYDNMFAGCTGLTKAPELPATTLADFCYNSMFSGCSNLEEAPQLPATKLSRSCYQYMFQGCKKIAEAPELPATDLSKACYYGMFSGCTSLTKAPELPATKLAGHCYGAMFMNCSALTEAPALPATSLATDCYIGMFQECSSLIKAPILPAKTLLQSCYYEMFAGCSKLNSVTCLATNISANVCLMDWLRGVSETGTFVKAPKVNWPTNQSGIPQGWAVEDYSSTDITTTIVKKSATPSTAFDLMGRKLTPNKKGLKIVEGRKYVVK